MQDGDGNADGDGTYISTQDRDRRKRVDRIIGQTSSAKENLQAGTVIRAYTEGIKWKEEEKVECILKTSQKEGGGYSELLYSKGCFKWNDTKLAFRYCWKEEDLEGGR